MNILQPSCQRRKPNRIARPAGRLLDTLGTLVQSYEHRYDIGMHRQSIKPGPRRRRNMAGTLQDGEALITGGGPSGGGGIAQAFAGEGARVVITGRDEARLQRAAETLQALGAQVLVAVSDARRRADA